jgi:hypothetical protein
VTTVGAGVTAERPVGPPHRLAGRARTICAGTIAIAVLMAATDLAGFFVLIPSWVGVVLTLAFLGLALFSMRWLYDARSNLDQLAGATPRWAPGWAIGAWLIPVAGVFIGAAVIADIVRNSVPRTDVAGPRWVTPLVWSWCAAFVGSSIFSVAWTVTAYLYASLTLAVGLAFGTQALNLLSAGLFVVIVQAVTHGQQAASEPRL